MLCTPRTIKSCMGARGDSFNFASRVMDLGTGLAEGDSATKTSCSLLLEVDLDDLAEHDHGGTLQNGNATQTLALLEAFDDERLLGLEDDLGHLVGLQADGIV